MEKKTCCIYLRVSTPDQVQGYSMEMMLDRCKTYISAQGAELVRVYRDEGISGGLSPNRREGLRQLLEDIKIKKDFNSVVVWRLDRISRNLRTLLELENTFTRAGVSLQSTTEMLNTSTAGGRAFFSMIGTFAEYEAGACSERTFSTMASKVGAIYLGGRPALGYKLHKKKLIIDPAMKDTVETIFETYLKCKNLSETARVVNAKGMITSYGKPFTFGKIKRILQNDVVTGATCWNRKCEKLRRWNPQDKWVVIPNTHEKIIDEVVYTRVQKILMSKHGRAYMLSGSKGECKNK